MKRLVLVAVLAAAVAAAVGAAPAGATTECRGLQVCVSIAGPWVVVPAGTPRQEVEFQLDCPSRFIVGGLDAQLTDPRIALRFDGKLGAPVTPGVTTSTGAVFRAVFTGPSGKTPSFQPRLGCIPAGGGGGGIPTVRRLYPPTQATTRHVRTVDLHPGVSHVTARCPAGALLVSGAHAVGFYSPLPPSPALVNAVRATHVLTRSAVVATAHAGRLQGVETVLQVAAVCAGGR